MSYAATATATQSTTMTEARVRAVMQKVAANLKAFEIVGLLSAAKARKWADDLTYLQLVEALLYFEIRIRSGATVRGFRYTVSSDGSLQQDSPSGGIGLYGLPADSTVDLVAELRTGTPASVYSELKGRGWGFNASRFDGPESDRRAFSSSGYGLVRTTLGEWP
ncbi:MAG TPA: hypothetical protein VMT03_16155 [Polyangia bacterium]|nr:hypothetical protein [Polyangia bacterium]